MGWLSSIGNAISAAWNLLWGRSGSSDSSSSTRTSTGRQNASRTVSGATSTSRLASTGGRGKAQNISLKLKFINSTGDLDPIEIIINKETASDTIIYNNFSSSTSMINYAIEHKSFDFAADGILVSPGSSIELDESFYQAFTASFDVSAANAIIDRIDIVTNYSNDSGTNTTKPISKTIFCRTIDSENLAQNNFSEEEFILWKNNDLPFAGKVLATDTIDYPVSNNILSFDYYTKYDTPIDLTLEEIETLPIYNKSTTSAESGNESGTQTTSTGTGNGSRSDGGGSSTGGGRRSGGGSSSSISTRSGSSGGSTSRSSGEGTRVSSTGSSSNSRASSVSRSSSRRSIVVRKTNDTYCFEEINGEYVYVPLSNIEITIEVTLNTQNITKLSIDLFPPAIKNKLFFVPDIKNLSFLNVIKEVPFDMDIKSYFKIYSLALTCITKDNTVNPPISQKISKKIITETNPVIGENPNFAISIEELPDINVYKYNIQFKSQAFKDESSNEFVDMTLEFDQSGDENLDKILNDQQYSGEELYDYECAVKVFSNNTAIGKVSKLALENILIGKPIDGGTFEIARYKLKEGCKDFGDIHVFYGNVHLRKTGDKIKYTTEIIENELVIYIKYDPYYGEGTDNPTGKVVSLRSDFLILYDYICVNMDNVIELDINEIDKSTPIKITNTSSIIQNSDVVFSSNINIPLINLTDETVFIDAAQKSNKLQHYTYVTTLSEASTTTYLGVRAYKKHTEYYEVPASEEISRLNIGGLTYNVPAKLVLLTPYTTQETIYSFRNGVQTMQLNKTNVGFNYDKTNKKLGIRDILPNYHLSYEYLVDGKVSNDPENYNLTFYGLREEKGWVRTEIPEDISRMTPSDKQSYLFTLSYIKKTENSDSQGLSYYPLDGISDNQTIYNNIYINEYSYVNDNVVSSLRDHSIWEEKYSLITQDSDWKNDDNLYQKTTTYVKLPISSVSLTDFKTVIKNYWDRLELLNEEIPDPDTNNNLIYSQTEESLLSSVYHKYSSISKEYNPYTLDDIEHIENVPYNLYYRSTYFIKLPQQEYANHQETAYKMDLNIEPINPNISYGMIYAHYNSGFTYMPLYMGIKYDGAVQYYTDSGYYLIDFEDLDYRKEPRPTNSDIAGKKIFIKQKYKNVEDLSQENFDKDYVSKGYKFYRKVNTVKYVPVGNKQTIYDLDLSGDVVYADENKKIISKHDIDSIYYKASTDPDAWYSIDSAEIIFRDNNQNINSTITKDDNIRTYMLKEMNTDSEHGFNGIHYIVDFDGDFVEVKYEDVANEVASLPQGSKISTYYINKEGYNEFEVSENTFLTDVLVSGPTNLYVNYLYYGYNFKFYLNGKSKIPVDKIKSYVEDDTSKIYINASRLFKNVTTLPNFTSSDEVQLTGSKSSFLLEIEKSGNQAGLIKASNFSGNNPIIYCSIEPQYVPSFDIHNNINKKYYTTKNYKLTFGEITLEDKKDLTNIVSIDVANKKITLNSLLSEADGYNIDYDSLRFYKNGIYAYTLTHLKDNLTNASKIISYIQPDLAGNDPANTYTYSYEVLMSSKFFYSSYTVNDGINVGKDGSYFTNISVFDGKTGLTSKMLYLTPHIYTITNYKYTYTHVNDHVLVTKDMDLSNVSENEYHNYYVVDSKVPDSKIELDKNTNKSPSWWFSYCTKNTRFSLYTKLVEVGETEYNGQIINNTYQLFDPYLNIPYTIKYNGNIYGLIFNENPYIVHDSSYVLVTAAKINSAFPNTSSKRFTYCCYEDESSVEPYYVPFEHSGDEVDQKVFQIIGETYNKDNDNSDGDIYDRDDANFLKAKHYYENLDLNEVIRKVYVKYLPCEYEYEVVPLQEFIYKSKGIDDNVFQNRESIPYELKEKNAFELANAKKIKFTGTYTWIAPEFSYISTYELSSNSYNSDEKTYIYKSKKIISRSGYWSKDYVEDEVPFKISSYNFYPKNEISSVNITYSFIPNSYILMSEIYHPEISYDYLVNDIYEYYKYTYIINGIEKDYPLNGEIILNPDNTYSGIINVLDKAKNDEDLINNSDDITLISYNGISQIKVKLYRKLDIAVNSNVKNIVHQNSYTSYNWYAYTQATPLTNEKVPYLYKKEIIPAHTKKVQYWNKDTNSYAVKEIIDSYSYYSYEYTYEVIPFKVASYIFTDDLRISNFYDLGAYIISLKDGITGVLGEQTKATKDLTTKITGSVDDLISLGREVSETWNENYSKHSEIINSTLATNRNELKSNLTNLSNILDTSIDDFNKKSTEAITYLNTSLSSYFAEQNSMLNTRLDDLNQTHVAKMEELSGYVHNDLIGTDKFEIVSTNTEWTYTYYKHGTYQLSSESESNNIVSVDSLGKIFKNSMYSDYEHYKVTYHADGSFTKTTYTGEQGIAEILANFTTQEKLPDYNQFMVKLVPAMFANVDFEGHYEIQYDAYGNVISTMKRNPINVAKSTIFRADTLWKELKKKGIVE